MKRLTIRQARENLTDLERLLAKEGEVMITRRGTPVARLLPVGVRRKPMPSHRKLREKMMRLRVPSERLVREERDER